MSKKTTLNDLTRGDLYDMSTKSLEETYRKAVKTVRSRQKSLEEHHLRYSPALKGLKKSNFYNKPTRNRSFTKNKEKQEAIYRGNLIRKIEKSKTFLNRETANVRGMQKINRSLQQRLNMKRPPSERFLKNYWKMYDKLKDNLNQLGSYLTSDQLQTDIYNAMNNMKFTKGTSQEEKENAIIGYLQNRYNETQEELHQIYQDTNEAMFELGDEDDEDLPF